MRAKTARSVRRKTKAKRPTLGTHPLRMSMVGFPLRGGLDDPPVLLFARFILELLGVIVCLGIDIVLSFEVSLRFAQRIDIVVLGSFPCSKHSSSNLRNEDLRFKCKKNPCSRRDLLEEISS